MQRKSLWPSHTKANPNTVKKSDIAVESQFAAFEPIWSLAWAPIVVACLRVRGGLAAG